MSSAPENPSPRLPTGKELGSAALRMTKQAVARQQRTGTPSPKGPGAMDVTQGVIDLAGMVDPFGVADLTNAMISTVRAYREPKRRFEHLRNAAVSAISMIPYAGDYAKVAVAKRDVHAAMMIANGTRYLRKVLKISKVAAATSRAYRAGAASAEATHSQHEASQSFAVEAARVQAHSELSATAATASVLPQTDAYQELPEQIAEQSEDVREHLEEARPGLFRRAGRLVKNNPGESIAVAEGLMRVGLILADKRRDTPTRVKDAWSEIVDTVSRASSRPSAWEASHTAITRGLDTFLPEGGLDPGPGDDDGGGDYDPGSDAQFSVRQRNAIQSTARRSGVTTPRSRRYDPDLTMIAQARAERDRRRAGGGTIDWDNWQRDGDDPQPSSWQRFGRMARRAAAPVMGTARGAYGLARDVVVPAASAAMGTVAGGVIVSRLERARREREEHGLFGSLARQAYRTFVPATSRAAIGVGVAATGAAVSTTRVMVDFGKSLTDLTKSVRGTNDVLLSNIRLLAQYNGHLATTYAFSELNQNLRRRFIASQTAGSYRALSSAQSTLGSQTAKYQSLAINFFNRAASFYTTFLSLGIAVAEKVTGIGTIVTLLNRAMGGMAKWTAAPHEMLLKDLADGTIMKARSKRKHGGGTKGKKTP